MTMTIKRSAVAFVGLVALVTGCGGPTAEEAAREFGPAWCAKMQACLGGLYAAQYPKDGTDNGTSECVGALVSSLKDRDARSACNDDEIAACKSDVQKISCETLLNVATQGASAMPSSCSKC